MCLGSLAMTDFHTWNFSVWDTCWDQRNGCCVWGSFPHDILIEDEEKVAYRELLTIKVRLRDIDCQSLRLRYLHSLFYILYKVWVILWCVRQPR